LFYLLVPTESCTQENEILSSRVPSGPEKVDDRALEGGFRHSESRAGPLKVEVGPTTLKSLTKQTLSAQLELVIANPLRFLGIRGPIYLYFDSTQIGSDIRRVS
jgi:hypothetical protein